MTALLLGLAGLLMFGYLSGRGSNAGFKLTMPLGGSLELTSTKKLTVSQEKIDTFNSVSYFISSELGLAFKKPETPTEWMPVESHDGIPSEQLAYANCVIDSSATTDQTAQDEELAAAPAPDPEPIVSRTLVQATGPTLRVRMTPRTTVSLYGTDSPSGLTRPCDLPFRNAMSIMVFPRDRLKKALGTELSLPGFLAYAVTALQIQLDTLIANPSQILGTYTWRANRVRLEGREDHFTEYRGFSFTQTKKNYYVTEIAFSPDSHSSPARWAEMQKMLESFRLIEP